MMNLDGHLPRGEEEQSKTVGGLVHFEEGTLGQKETSSRQTIKNPSPPQKDKDQQWDIQSLFTKCEELVERFEYALALKFCDRILELDPDHVETLLLKADVLMESGKVEDAREILLELIKREPDHGHEKFLSLAQISQGEEALHLYSYAANLLQQQQKVLQDETRQELASIYCSMAELYLTDLCFAKDAEEQCERHLKASLSSLPNNHEALQVMASMRLCQHRAEEAAEALRQSIAVWTSLDPASIAYPSYEFRLGCARLLIELEQFEDVQSILESLLQDDDEMVEPWYLQSLSLFSLHQIPGANEALQQAERLLASSSVQLPELGEAIEELRSALAKASSDIADGADREISSQEEGEDDDDDHDECN